MGLLLGLGIPLVYLLAIGGFLPYFNKGLKARCSSCVADRGYPYNCGRDHEFAGFFMAVLWPIGLVNHFVSSRIDGQSRVEKRHAKEIARAEHEAELAKIAARTTRDLEIANGIVEAPKEKVTEARRRLGEEYSYDADIQRMLDSKDKRKGGKTWRVSD